MEVERREPVPNDEIRPHRLDQVGRSPGLVRVPGVRDEEAEVLRTARPLDSSGAEELVHRRSRHRRRLDRRRRGRDASDRGRPGDDGGVGRRGLHEPHRLAGVDRVAHGTRRRPADGGHASRSRGRGARKRRRELVRELRDLGRPDLEAGDDVEQALDDAVAGAGERATRMCSPPRRTRPKPRTRRSSSARWRSSHDDFAALVAQAGDVVATLQSASLFDDASAELEQAFAESDSCQALQADS